MVRRSDDVIVVGAGPAGATLAYELAKRGIGVLLLEREKLPRHKCCAGGLTSKAVKLLGFDISEVVEDVVYEISITFDLRNPYLRQHDQPLIYTVMRDVFDHFLVKKARQRGAVLVDGQNVRRIQMSGDWVEVSTADSILRSRLVVGADGAYSVVTRELGMGRSMEYGAAIGSEIVVPEEELARWKSRAQMELGCIPGGYAWVFPKRDHLSIGVACPASKAKHLNGLHQEFLNSLGTSDYTISRSSSHFIPTCTKGRLVWHDKVLLLGDAAGLADPLTGEGIHNAILSAQLAVPVIENCLAHANAKLEDYQEAVEERIISELRIARVLSKFFIRFPHLAFGMLNRSDETWRVGCGLMSGELKYADMTRGAGGFKGIVDRLFRT